jgi:ATP-dependent RNA helicase DeaD
MATPLEAMHLRPELVAACRKQGFKLATPVQAQVIPEVLQGRDLIVEAKTGSGKTLAYGLPLLQAEPLQTRSPEALVVTPTRELAEQVAASLARTAGTLPRRVVALTGRGGLKQQAAALAEGAQIVVGTMGRLEELLTRNLLAVDCVRTLVLDEVDELVQGGFSESLAGLLARLPPKHQTLLFSASIPQEVERLAKGFMHQPRRLQLTPARDVPSELSHQVLRTTVGRRLDDLGELLEVGRPYQALLFCGTRHEAEEVQEALTRGGLEAEFLHGELPATKRRKLLTRFRTGELPVLVATDLAARGLDLPGVELVVNYSLPETPVAYMHRAGRTGRAGKPGVVVTLLIEQQHARFEHLRETVPFEKVEVHGDRLVVRPIKSREDRDLEFRQLPRRPAPPPGSGRGEGRRPAGRTARSRR